MQLALNRSLWRALLAALFVAAGASAFAAQLDPKGLPTLAPLVNEVTPAVVNVSVITRSPLEDNPLFRDPFFRRFFNLPDRPQRREQAAGSGVIVDAARGYVLTNHHVISRRSSASRHGRARWSPPFSPARRRKNPGCASATWW